MPKSARVQVLDANGRMLGSMTAQEALEKAYALGLDLVKVAPDARPAICKIMDYGKSRHEQP